MHSLLHNIKICQKSVTRRIGVAQFLLDNLTDRFFHVFTRNVLQIMQETYDER